ncbi:MAG: right-handed parallel beta-helix repeat-containing protein, partial [Planctomycetota bacterium]
MRQHLKHPIVALVFALSAQSTLAGDLTPPPGAIMPTGLIPINPQTVTFPINITQPGSYIFLGDITLPGATNGMSISASDVTIDLNGFTFDGAGVGSEGILSDGSNENVVIRNGTIKSFNGGGVVLHSTTRAIVEDVRAIDIGIEGIRVGNEGIVRRCVSSGNGHSGIYVLERALVAECQVFGENTTSFGIFTRGYSTIENCQIAETTNRGIYLNGLQCRA